ncbi:MAG: hypothetical protein ABW228_00930 [Thermoleophilaceae bacterium]
MIFRHLYLDSLASGRDDLTMYPSANRPRRYALVPDDPESAPRRPGQIRRYSLARVAPASRSALGVDRLERLEEVAQRGSDGAMMR